MNPSQKAKLAEMRGLALACLEAGVAAADPARAVRAALAARPEFLTTSGRLLLVAIGKAAGPMMRAALPVARGAGAPVEAMLITNYENETKIDGCACFASGHPTPDEAGADAAGAVIQSVEKLAKNDRAVLLLSGGGSALAPAPIEGVPLRSKIKLNDLLLASGAPIDEINTVRRRLSRLKGGGFARLAAPASVGALILSDVPGDDLAAVASGPTVADPSPPSQAVEILKRRGVWAKAPNSVKNALSQPARRRKASHADNILIGGNNLSVRAMTSAPLGGWRIVIEGDWLDGDVADAAARLTQRIRDAALIGRKTALLFGGETTVRLTGSGRGGRNQELALRVAAGISAQPIDAEWVFLSAGTDGRDGPTDVAGGLVDLQTIDRLGRAGVDLDAELTNNNSYDALAACGDLLTIGATGTNVADLQVALIF